MYLKEFKNTLSLVKFNIEIQKNTSQTKTMLNIEIQIISLYDTNEFISIET